MIFKVEQHLLQSSMHLDRPASDVHLVSSAICFYYISRLKVVTPSGNLSCRKRKKSTDAKFGEYGAWSKIFIKFLVKILFAFLERFRIPI